MDSGSGTVKGKIVSYNKGPWFESSHRQSFRYCYLDLKEQNNDKEASNCSFALLMIFLRTIDIFTLEICLIESQLKRLTKPFTAMPSLKKLKLYSFTNNV